jgi:phage tail-like protein
VAEHKGRPYADFDFVVDLTGGASAGTQAGFRDLAVGGVDLSAADLRAEHARRGAITKISGINKATDVTMKRGVVSSDALNQWLDDIKGGGPRAVRTVTVELQDPDHASVVHTWRLIRARIVKHTSGPLQAHGTDVAIDELTLSCEGLETG